MSHDFGLTAARGGAFFADEDAGVPLAGLSRDRVSALGDPSAIRIDPRGFDFSAPQSSMLAGPAGPGFGEEVSFLNGLNPDGTITNQSYWGASGETARKWGNSRAGTGATITYSFDPTLTANEQNTFKMGFALWESVANVNFVESTLPLLADLQIAQLPTGGAFVLMQSTQGSGDRLGRPIGTALLSIDDSVQGFELTGDLDTVGGYGMSTVIHELGHALGLGHAGNYNGAVNPATQQFSQYDERQWSIMSYIFYAQAAEAKYGDSYEVTGTDWGTDDGFLRQASHTWMPADIAAIQQLYGVADNSPLDGGDTFGFNCTVTGLLQQFFDFTINEHPVITLFSLGTDNIFDCSGFSDAVTIDLNPGAFSSVGTDENPEVGRHINNVVIDFNTVIETGIGGSGNDLLIGGDIANELFGNGGEDTLFGGGGRDKLKAGGGQDTFSLASVDASDADKISGFKTGKDQIALDSDVYGLAEGALAAGKFAIGTQAGDVNDRLIYDESTGKLFFDADGTGADDQVLIATLGKAPTLEASDFIVI